MPADYRIAPDHGLAYIKFSGHVTMDEVAVCATAFAADDNHDKAAKHIVDFSQVTSYDSNYVRIIEMQAKLADVFVGDASQWIFVYYAPTKIGREMANYGIRAWSDVANVVIRMTQTESDTLDVMGFSQRRLADLLRNVAPI